ncbi:MAG: magnesium transporter [Methanobacterium sp.]
MTFISQLIKKDVQDPSEEKIGKSKDFMISTDEPYPLLKAMIMDISKDKKKNVPMEDINQLGEKIKLRVDLNDVSDYQIKKTDIKITDILDKQIVDANGKKIDRVNDIEISEVDGNYRLIGLNVGFKGIIRRLGIEGILKDLKIETPGEYIAWDDINIYESDEYNLKLKVTDYDLKKLHPSDMAEIIKELNDKDLTTILNSLDEDIAAGVLEEISSNRQVCLLDSMDNKKTANILNKMSPDSATDLFGCLSEDKADELLDLMNPEEANDIRKLLNYSPDTAGGIMTTEFAVINEEYTAHEILDYLRNIVKNIRFIYYIYLVSDEVLTGIASLKDVIFADPDQKANEFMITDLITVDELENQIDVAKKIAKYNLLAIPVINNINEIKGIVTVDDAIGIILSSNRKIKSQKRFTH